MKDLHSCSYYCTRPACVRAQRDELRDRIFGDVTQEDVDAFVRSLRSQGTPWADGCANVILKLWLQHLTGMR